MDHSKDILQTIPDNDFKLSACGITHSYHSPAGQKTPALHDVNIQVKEQEFVGIVGPSGCGKSTLLNIMAGLVSPNQGRVYLDGAPLSGVTQSIGYMSQADTLMPWRTVLGNVEFALELQGKAKKERREISRDLIEKAGLGGFENSYPHELSGGMKKRVTIIRILATQSDTLFMDEPFGALDVFTKEMLQDEILKLWQDTKKTILFVTHDLTEAITLCDRVILMTARPSTINTEYDIPLARPRSALETRFQPEFVEMQRLIWNDLRTEVLQAAGECK
ncbi:MULTISPECIES: ABC transporter ATP-binding protein [unclassified Pseudodesulfovibrio]|uniref:ABC transporter ATP-binding protein n=1 Tax=unclassified Pseudodesulfovibrio TaxID=2661612 RepID=UPI000FEBB989|nr:MULTISPECIES: ABC transporter ATP-binding protein [unclassified Pseudodesulfovibrio]MCJ2164305.1 ABC transporter ATP-binding protein [Pseudodesulfovibrio sp. S3-i]RWU04769.1 ABC transporter ATP-binding protein [Pseudodesulfovibrio sp. S3]